MGKFGEHVSVSCLTGNLLWLAVLIVDLLFALLFA
jgi:hypothetical protein